MDGEALPLAERFRRVYESYPRRENFWPGFQTFQQLAGRGELPALEELIRAIRRQREEPGWQREGGRFVPRIAKWLAQRRWLDVGPAVFATA